ncbi:MAG: PspC domain-containing protein [Chloroherpetonaceae bacterium]|nr:PspC domain-containing protein [Chloroherpetonaceae bacterium]MCS7212349.1 PspC domain-containing protein [Chloroherpetonaceae bacterium]MDW8019420.1 PspC domain-containing protein [Chloroherpetonaceae bacterium]
MKRLYRSSEDRIIGGVAAGIGEYFDVDPVFTRVLFVLLAFLSGLGLLLYLVLWIIMPKRPSLLANSTESTGTVTTGVVSSVLTPSPRELEAKRKQRTTIAGIILIVLGILILLDRLIPEYAVPLVLIAIGGVLLWQAFSKSDSQSLQ